MARGSGQPAALSASRRPASIDSRQLGAQYGVRRAK
jgi:hypothetical protein